MTESDAVPLLGETLRRASPREGVTMSLLDYEDGRLRVLFSARRTEHGIVLPLEAANIRDTGAWKRALTATLWSVYDRRDGGER